MKELKTDELKDIDGGFCISLGGIALISVGVPFVIGILDGIVNPLPCNK